ncbi:MAG: hypothetical protein AAF631_09245 [Pseudomonadota bacterium]
MARVLLIFALLLPACTTPSPDFIWADATHRFETVNGMAFKVYWTTSHAQAVRQTGYTRLPVQLLQARALVAIARVTGCRVIRRTVRGGAVRTDARINCAPG